MDIIEKRKGSKRISEIPKSILEQLNKGEIESANLVEWLAVDQILLLRQFLKNQKRENYFPYIEKNIHSLKKQTVMSLCKTIGSGLFEISALESDKDLFSLTKNHISDTVRNWACVMIEANPKFSFAKKVSEMKPLCDDSHFGVRELAWISIRPSLVIDLKKNIPILEKLSLHPKENIRRFASEISRPKGVWCKHIEELKNNPELGISILEPLKSDSSKYVRDSVGNWLNDAFKSNPKWVKEICKRWKKKSPTPETEYIIKRALRSDK